MAQCKIGLVARLCRLSNLSSQLTLLPLQGNFPKALALSMEWSVVLLTGFCSRHCCWASTLGRHLGAFAGVCWLNWNMLGAHIGLKSHEKLLKKSLLSMLNNQLILGGCLSFLGDCPQTTNQRPLRPPWLSFFTAKTQPGPWQCAPKCLVLHSSGAPLLAETRQDKKSGPDIENIWSSDQATFKWILYLGSVIFLQGRHNKPQIYHPA